MSATPEEILKKSRDEIAVNNMRVNLASHHLGMINPNYMTVEQIVDLRKCLEILEEMDG